MTLLTELFEEKDWLKRAIKIQEYHKHFKKTYIKWTYKETAERLGMSKATVVQCVGLAELNKKVDLSVFPSQHAALKYVAARKRK
jgi:hypothetical protein